MPGPGTPTPAGPLGVTCVLEVTLGPDGRLVSGRILPVIQQGEGIPVKDPANRPMLFHCAGGNRASALWAIKRVVVDGWAVDRAIAERRHLLIGVVNATDWGHDAVLGPGTTLRTAIERDEAESAWVLDLKKGAVACLEGEPVPGGMTLRWLLPAKVARAC